MVIVFKTPFFIYPYLQHIYIKMNIKKIIREEFGDLGWMEDVEPTFKNTDFKFNGKEYWVDLSTLHPNERHEIFLYLIKYTNLSKDSHQFDGADVKNNILDLTFNGIVIHCGGEDEDYVPFEGHICFMRETFNDDEYTHNSEYIDGREVINYARLLKKDGDTVNESEDLDWADLLDIKGSYDVDVHLDYIDAWDDFIVPFIESGVSELEGYINSNDYDGTIEISVYNDSFKNPNRVPLPMIGLRLNIEVNSEYDEDKDDFLIKWWVDDGYQGIMTDSGEYYTNQTKDRYGPIKDHIKKYLTKTI